MACTGSTTPGGGGGTGGAAPALHVSGNQLVTAAGATYRLLGVNRSSGEFACVQGNGHVGQGPPDQASVDAMKTWNIHAVRVPLNEECWLGTFDVPAASGGATYQQSVKDYVDLLVANGITPIVEMHWNYGVYTGTGAGCSDANATCQKPMPDAQYAPTFWTQRGHRVQGQQRGRLRPVQRALPGRGRQLGDATAAGPACATAAPAPASATRSPACSALVNAVRATGATNVHHGRRPDLDQRPDPVADLQADRPGRQHHGRRGTRTTSTPASPRPAGTARSAPVAAQVPVTAGEIGQNTCAHDYIDQVMAWADAHGVGYLAWTWNPWGCSAAATS